MTRSTDKLAVRAVVTDIEGTTSDIAFVHEVLFPYAARALPDFVRAHAAQPDVAAALEDARGVMGAPDADLELVITQLLEWLARDQKVTPLKDLQGLVWREGYRSGDFTGHVYLDAAAALARWQARGLALYVYSSGSVAAQKLLFGHSDHGDLTGLFTGYFDTRTGGKRERASYAAIAAEIGLPAAQILFLSDVVGELDAAAAAGLQTCLLARGGAAEQPSGAANVVTNPHPIAQDFASIPQLRETQ